MGYFFLKNKCVLTPTQNCRIDLTIKNKQKTAKKNSEIEDIAANNCGLQSHPPLSYDLSHFVCSFPDFRQRSWYLGSAQGLGETGAVMLRGQGRADSGRAFQ